MKNIYLVIIPVVLLVSGCITSELPSTYTDPNGLFSVGIAKGWVENKESANLTEKIVGLGTKGIGVSVVQFKNGGTGVVFVVASLPEQLFGKVTTDILIAGLQSSKIIPTGVQLKPKTFGSIDGKEIVLDGPEANQALTGGVPVLKAKYIFAVSRDKMITISYISGNTLEDFDKNLNEAESMINTFKLLK